MENHRDGDDLMVVMIGKTFDESVIYRIGLKQLEKNKG
jgi:hypothetical protein